jgi:hypothetical protein
MALKPIGMGSQKPVMGSDYLQSLAQQYGLSQQPTGSNAENVARLAMSAMNPATGARAVGRVVEPTMQALGPKAYGLLEDYMVKSGGMIPLTAYHGTPYNIQGKFDINKVGTGEGAQAYGYGMYFAENPSVAGQYKTALSNIEMSAKGKPLTAFGVDERVVTHSPNIFDKPLDYGLAEYNKSLKTQLLDYPELKNDLNYPKELFDQRVEFLKSYGKGSREAQAGEALENFAKTNGYPDVNMSGNLYKVDIPDADIPFMLDYDKPLSQQPKAVQDALAKYDSDLYSPKGNDYDSNELGQSIYQRIVQDNVQKFGLGGNSKRASEDLNALGIKGIRYYDEGSRQAGGTSNFVVFDPSTVNILEKNEKLIEGLLD